MLLRPKTSCEPIPERSGIVGDPNAPTDKSCNVIFLPS